jgi:hypothetical protein
VVFKSSNTPPIQIRIVDVETGEERTLLDPAATAGVASPRVPTWSHDGEWVAFIANPPTQHVKDYHENTNTTTYYTQETPCTHFGYTSYQTCWSELVPYLIHPDGSGGHWAYRSPASTDAATWNANKANYGISIDFPNWSWDDTRMAVTGYSDGALRVLTLASGTVGSSIGTGFSGNAPTWTRDDKILVRNTKRNADGTNIVTLSTDTNVLRQAWVAEPLPVLPLEQTFGDELGSNPGDDADVNGSTGSYSTSKTDLELPGIDIPLQFTRSYNSKDTTVGDFGPGWQHPFGARLTIAGNGDVSARAGDGQQLSYIKQADGSYRPYSGGTAELSLKEDGHYELTTDVQQTNLFDSAGKLTGIRGLHGRQLSLSYDTRERPGFCVCMIRKGGSCPRRRSRTS